MTQVWPVFGVAPVPSLLSMICKPEAVVIGFFPAVWADASWVAIGVETAAAMAARAVRIIVRREDRISVHLVRRPTSPWRFRAKWIPVRMKKTRQNKNLEFRF